MAAPTMNIERTSADEDAAMTRLEDTRRSPRIPCDLAIQYEVRGVGPRTGRIMNIGAGGVCLNTQGPIPTVGAEVALRFHLPLSKREIETSGKVRWSAEGKAGVEFIQLGLLQQDEIWRYYARESARQRQFRS